MEIDHRKSLCGWILFLVKRNCRVCKFIPSFRYPPPSNQSVRSYDRMDGNSKFGQKVYALFDIENDPNERNDLQNEHPEIVNMLLERLEYYER